jgi:hypothetical protein
MLAQFYERSCKYKEPHDAAGALTACAEVYHRRRDSMFAYKCHFCPHYHVGHSPQYIRDFVDEMTRAVYEYGLGRILVPKVRALKPKPRVAATM